MGYFAFRQSLADGVPAQTYRDLSLLFAFVAEAGASYSMQA